MTFVDWAHVVLPMSCLMIGVVLSYRHRRGIDRWAEMFDAWWSGNNW